MSSFLAIDIGASSGRHIVGYYENGVLNTREVFRFPNGVVTTTDGHLTWDIDALFENVVEGIAKAFGEFSDIKSLSVDTWGVDYVLMKGEEEIRPVYAYRDSRTERFIPQVHSKIPFSELYRRTGCQFQPFNTVYQLYCDMEEGRLNGVTDFLMIPEYILWRLSGVKAKEYTNATTTGLVSAETGEFDLKTIEDLGLPSRLFPSLKQPKSYLGEFRKDIASRVGGNCRLLFCATHDTASAVEGIPMEEDAPYISSGTWSLLGVKTEKAIADPSSEQANYSNEGGVGYNRYQKNIMGMWVGNELRRELAEGISFDKLTEMAKKSDCDIVVDVNAPEFLAPMSMSAAFDKAAGKKIGEVGDYFRCAYNSLAHSYAKALAELEKNTSKCYAKLYIVGGGAKNKFLNSLTAEATGKTVVALPIEATALGNLKLQSEADNELF